MTPITQERNSRVAAGSQATANRMRCRTEVAPGGSHEESAAETTTLMGAVHRKTSLDHDGTQVSMLREKSSVASTTATAPAAKA